MKRVLVTAAGADFKGRTFPPQLRFKGCHRGQGRAPGAFLDTLPEIATLAEVQRDITPLSEVPRP